MTDYDDSPDKSPGATRRTFLGAAAAAAGLTMSTASTTATDTTTTDATIETDDVGSTRATYDEHTGVPVFPTLYVPDEWDSSLTVEGYHYTGDEQGDVEAQIDAGQLSLTVSLDPSEARAIARDLEAAATHVEEGDA